MYKFSSHEELGSYYCDRWKLCSVKGEQPIGGGDLCKRIELMDASSMGAGTYGSRNKNRPIKPFVS